jgi:hypothetical protein
MEEWRRDLDKCQISIYDEDLRKIGRDAGLYLWDDLDKQKQEQVEKEGLSALYYTYSLSHMDNGLWFLWFRRKGHADGGKSEYSINLQTLKPTANSPKKYPIDPELIEKMKERYRRRYD